MVTMTYEAQEHVRCEGCRSEVEGLGRTRTIAPTMVSRTPAIAEMMAMMPEPIAEKIEPYENHCNEDEE